MNKKVIILTIIVLIGMISLPTAYKISKEHEANLILVVEKEFLYQATLCYKEDLCSTTITLQDLYTNDYITEKLTNPITKKYYSLDSYINLSTNEIKLIS